MIKNNKYFIEPSGNEGTFKEVFNRLASVGAGRPVDRDGFPTGPWTPDLLAAAISEIAANRSGIELRTVQLWFQDNDKGISADNIRWLARIFGCDDPNATSIWQAELSASNSRLIAQRREKRKQEGISRGLSADDKSEPEALGSALAFPAKVKDDESHIGLKRRMSLAQRSEAIISRGSPLDLPSTVFAGVVALCFISYLMNIHNATYTRPDGIIKQVGYLWAVNWMSVYLICLPLFLFFVGELVVFWKTDGRLQFLSQIDRVESDRAWVRNVEASSYTYWAVFLICVIFAGLLQWIGMRLIPLLKCDENNYATDWGTLAIARPEFITVSETAVFSGLAYLYMCLTFYLLFAGLILLYTVSYDLWKVSQKSNLPHETEFHHLANDASRLVIRAIFRCTILGILIAASMKLQSAYLSSGGANIVIWLVGDMISVFRSGNDLIPVGDHRSINHFTSLLVALATLFVFLFSISRLSTEMRKQLPMWQMTAVIAVLCAAYLLIGAFPGFSLLLSLGLLLATYGLINPDFGRRRVSELRGNHSVS